MINVMNVMPGLTCDNARALSLKSVNQARMEALLEYAAVCRHAHIQRLRSEFREWCEVLPRELHRLLGAVAGLNMPNSIVECIDNEDRFVEELVASFPVTDDGAIEKFEERRRLLSYEANRLIHFTLLRKQNESDVKVIQGFLNDMIRALRLRMYEDLARIDRVDVELIAVLGEYGIARQYGAASLSEVRHIVAAIEDAISV